jgi:hypothetical protein
MENRENKSLTEILKWKIAHNSENGLAHEQNVARFRTYLEDK